MIFLVYMFIGNVICVDLHVHKVKSKVPIPLSISISDNSTFEDPQASVKFPRAIKNFVDLSRSLFSNVDTNHNGYLELAEVKTGLPPEYQGHNIDEFVEAGDKDGNGKLDIDEVVFVAFDTDLGGTITLEELKKRFQKLDDDKHAESEALQNLIEIADEFGKSENQNGMIDFNELVYLHQMYFAKVFGDAVDHFARSVFSEADSDNDGYLNLQEVEASGAYTGANIKALMEAGDKDGDKQLNIPEAVFLRFDDDKNGAISMKELKSQLKPLAVDVNLEAEVLAYLIEMADNYGKKKRNQEPDGMIDYNELLLLDGQYVKWKAERQTK